MAQSVQMASSDRNTFPKYLRYNAVLFPSRAALREKNYGVWQTWTWSEYYANARGLAAGLANLGLARGAPLIIVGENRPRLYCAVAAAQCLGAIPVPTYQDAVVDEMAYIVEHVGAQIAIAENQEQVDKLIEIAARVPCLKHIIYDDPRGLEDYPDQLVHNYDTLVAADQPFDIDSSIDAADSTDPAIILYTSGTTGTPKGVVLNFDNLIITARDNAALEKLRIDEEVLAYLPMAWVGDHVLSYCQSLVVGYCINCPESQTTLMQDLREIGPTYYFAPPRVFETLLTNLTIRMHDASALKQKIFSHFIALAKKVGVDILEGRPVPWTTKLHYRCGEWLIYAPLRDALGLGRIRLAYTAGEAIGPEIFAFFRSIGINLKQIYGQTEAAVFVTVQPDGEVWPDTVGKPAANVQIRISDSGEVLYRSPGVFVEYFKNSESTKETKTQDGWVYTGDAGFMTSEGHLRIIDRAKDVGKFVDGKLFAPKYIENKLKFSTYIREAVAFGGDQEFCCVFVNIDEKAVGNWAEAKGLAYASFQELASLPEVYTLIGEEIATANASLANDALLSHSQVRRFLLLQKELDADDGELTRTSKLRRRFINERYAGLIEALYDGSEQAAFSLTIKFEDGREGNMQGVIRICTDACALANGGEHV